MLLNVEPPEYSIYFQKPLSVKKVEGLLESLVISMGYDIHVSQQKNMILTRKEINHPVSSFLGRFFKSVGSTVLRDELYENVQGYFTVLDEKPAITVSYVIPYNLRYREIGLKFDGAKDEKTKIKIFKEIDAQVKKFISKNI